MRNILIAVLLLLAAFGTFAQNSTDSSKHLSFKGVPLDGTLDQFVSKMKQSGFKLLSSGDNLAGLEGDFAGYKGCLVSVSTLKQKDLVSKIVVVFSERETWETLSGDYTNLKELLTEKYGKPSEVVEKFDSESSARDDQSRMFAVKVDQCKYYSIWSTDKGEIQLSIDHRKFEKCFIKLTYLDKLNGDTMRKKALDDL